MISQKFTSKIVKFFSKKKSDLEDTLLDTELEEPNYFT